MTSKVDWEGTLRDGLKSIGHSALKAGMRGLGAGVESLTTDADKLLRAVDKKTRKIRTAVQKALAELDHEDE